MPLIRSTPEQAPPASAGARRGLRERLRGRTLGGGARGRAIRPDVSLLWPKRSRGETDARVREAIFTALARIATPESVDAVLAVSCGPTTRTLRPARWTRCARCRRRSRPHLEALLADPDADVRLLACELVRDAGAADGRGCCAR